MLTCLQLIEFLEFYLDGLLGYFDLRYSVRANDIYRVQEAWKNSWPLFHATNKRLYAKLSMMATYIYSHAHPAIKDVLNMRLVSLHGLPNHYIGPDCVTEKENLMGRNGIHDPTEESVKRFYRNINYGMLVNQQTKSALFMDPQVYNRVKEFQQERKFIHSYLDRKFGATLRAIQKPHRMVRDFRGNFIDLEDRVSSKIQAAIEQQQEWVDNHSDILSGLNDPMEEEDELITSEEEEADVGSLDSDF